ncbi:hypothetical protein BO94DRAFT_425418, partial [Aspergillus sclerotioniger CBS 115572]
MAITLSVLVFRAEPFDCIEFRHTSIYLDYGDGTQSTLHIVGASRDYHFEEVEKDHAESGKLERHILVTTFHEGFTSAMIKDACSNTRVNNDGSEWNCHHWVGDVLAELMKLEILIKD